MRDQKRKKEAGNNGRQKYTKRPANGKRKFHGFRFVTMLLVVAVGFELVVGSVGLIGIQSMIKDEPDLNLDDFFAQESTLIYDADGNQIADVGTQLRENITYDEVPEAMVDAFLSIEDSRYFTHNGFDLPRFVQSTINTVLHGNVQGGSTFTMQLVKLTYFQNDDKGISRTKDIQYKIQQIDLAMQLEKKSNKKDIFAMYLNKMNFGGIGNIRGVQKAAQQYFGKNVSDLNISECALLAGVVNSPYYYDPHNYLDHATTRRNTVLSMMLRHGYIDEKEYNLAKSIKVEDLLIDPTTSLDANGYQYQAYIDEVLKEAEQVTNQDPLSVSMQIYTAMDPDVQSKVEDIEAGTDTNVVFADDAMEMGSITENNQTGEIVAIGGGRNYASGGSMLLNHATEQYKQPGSSVKPFLDYAPTFDYVGWATSHELDSAPLQIGNWTYQNAGGADYGIVDLTKAIDYSLNTPAIQAMQAAMKKQGQDWYVKYMKALGFDDNVADSLDLSYAIGGNNFVCTPEQLMAAHAVMMNGGNYITPHTITKIVYRSGQQDDYVPKYQKKQVMSDAAAYMSAQLMYNAVHDNVPNYLPILVRDYATYGKTGTTDWGDSGLQYGIPKAAMKDKWMVTSDTQFTTAVWVGYEKAVAGQSSYFTNAKAWMNIPGHISSEILDAVHADGSKPDALTQPSDVVEITHVKGIFPYVAPSENMPSDMVVTGLIKKGFDKLEDFNVDIPALQNLSSFTAEAATNTLDINFTWADYPGETDAATPEPTEGSTNLFNINMLTGKVLYKARVSQNGSTLGEITSETPTSTQTVTGLAWDTDTEVCGYYGYESTSDVSNEICVTIHTPVDPSAVTPDAGEHEGTDGPPTDTTAANTATVPQ